MAIDLSAMGLILVGAFTGAGNELRIASYGLSMIIRIDTDRNRIADPRNAIGGVTALDVGDFVP